MVTWDLTDRESIFASLPKGGVGAELGVDWGEFSKDILRLAEPRLLYLIDCWVEQSVEAYGHDPANSHHDIKYQQCLGRFVTDERVRLVKAFSQDVAPHFPDAYFDWFFIDANHLQSYQDCVAWWPKVKPGGWLLGHDYVVAGDFITVKTDVDRFAAENNLPLLISNEEVFKCWIAQKPEVPA